MLLHRHVRLTHSIVDSYGRLVANVSIVDGLFLFKNGTVNRQMVSKGLAKNTSGFDDVANIAKAKGLGIYSTQCRRSVPRSECTIKGNLQPEGT